MDIDPLWFGILAVVGATMFMNSSALRLFGRKLSLIEMASVCWVAFSIHIGTFFLYVGLKLPLGLTRAWHIPAVSIAVCVAVLAMIYLARVVADWEAAVRVSIFGLLIFILIVGCAILWFNRHRSDLVTEAPMLSQRR